jgi:CRISPR-associated endoribonuclease Cas6
MRLFIELQPVSDRNQLSDTIQFVIPKLIKFIISRSKDENASKYKDKKLSEFLNYSLKISPKPNIYNNTIIIGENYRLNLTLSSYSNEVINIITNSLNNLSYLLILNHKFKINNVELLEISDIKDNRVKIRPLSPILSGEIKDGRKFPFYYKWNDENFFKVMISQIKSEYKNIFNEDVTELELNIEYDKGYLKHHKNITQLVTVHKRTQRAIWSPMYISGDIKLIEFTLDRGLGINREIGYGMIESYIPKKREKIEPKKKVNIDELPDNFGNLIENNPLPEDDTRGLYD